MTKNCDSESALHNCSQPDCVQELPSIPLIDNKINSSSPPIEDCGLLAYRKWWEKIEVEIIVNGNTITGTPIFIDDNTLRVINQDNSYFIPLNKIDFIKTRDGLQSSFESADNGN